MIRSTRIKNKVRQYLYRPHKSKLLSKSAFKSLKDLNKKINDGIDGMLEEMGYPQKDEKDEKNNKSENDKKGQNSEDD